MDFLDKYFATKKTNLLVLRSNTDPKYIVCESNLLPKLSIIYLN